VNTGTDGTAPACTAWCQAHPVGHREWDQHPAAVTKLCRRVIEAAADLDGTPVTIDVQRFASLDEWDVRTVGPVTVQLTHDAPAHRRRRDAPRRNPPPGRRTPRRTGRGGGLAPSIGPVLPDQQQQVRFVASDSV
jgi:hypothetical protein